MLLKSDKIEKKFRIAIMASGNGTNAENVVHYFEHHPSIRVVLILSNRSDAFVLQRARNLSVPSKVFSKEELVNKVPHWLAEYDVTHVVLAGFLLLLPSSLIQSYPDRIINIHPALLPKYGGKGMYGERVHQQVKADGVAVTGITIHLVNEKYDEGKVMFQQPCEVRTADTVEDIANRVHALEYEAYPRVIENWIMSGEN